MVAVAVVGCLKSKAALWRSGLEVERPSYNGTSMVGINSLEGNGLAPLSVFLKVIVYWVCYYRKCWSDI